MALPPTTGLDGKLPVSGKPATLTTARTVSVAGMGLWASAPALESKGVSLIPFPKVEGSFGHLHVQVGDSLTKRLSGPASQAGASCKLHISTRPEFKAKTFRRRQQMLYRVLKRRLVTLMQEYQVFLPQDLKRCTPHRQH